MAVAELANISERRIELLCAAQAMDLFTNMKPGEGTFAAYQVIRQAISHLEKDRILSEDIAYMRQLMDSGKILEAVEEKVGALCCKLSEKYSVNLNGK